MTQHAERNTGRNMDEGAGSGRRGDARRARGWTAALERIRTAERALAGKATARLLDAVFAASEVLDPEQRQGLVESLVERHRH